MSKKDRAELLDYGERVVYMPDHGTKSYAGKADVIDAIQTGMLARKVVEYRYADARGRARSGYLAPFVMIVYRNGLYAIGARLKDVSTDARTAPLGVFAIERFADAEHLRAHEFKLPKNLDAHLGSVMQGAFGPHLPDEGGPHDVIVEFTREKALLVSSRTWHPSQQVTRLSNGRVRLEFQVPALAPVVSWILEWGPHARVISPDALVNEVIRELDEALAQYRNARGTR